MHPDGRTVDLVQWLAPASDEGGIP